MRRFRRKKRFNFLIPFLVIVLLGLMFFFVFQFWNVFWVVQKGDAVFYLIEGRAKIMPFGNQEWENLHNGVKVKLGDRVKMASGGRGVIRFYDGTVARMADNTELKLDDISKNDENQEILLALSEGRVWVNKPKKAGTIRKTDFVISTVNAAYSITGTVFNLDRIAQVETLRVLSGEVSVDIFEESNGKKLSIFQEIVGIGQETRIDEIVMKAFLTRQTINFKQAISSEFQSSEWFIWNTFEDDNNVDYANPVRNVNKPNMNDILKNNVSTGGISVVDTSEKKVEENDVNNNIIDSLTKPTIEMIGDKKFTNGLVFVKDGIVLSGKISGADGIYVNNYRLTKFKSGDLNWTYNLSEKLGNLKKGINKIEVYGVSLDGKKSEVLIFSFEYKPPQITTPKLEMGDINSVKNTVKTVNTTSTNAVTPVAVTATEEKKVSTENVKPVVSVGGPNASL